MVVQAQRSIDSVLIAPLAMTNTQTATANLDTKGSNYATIMIPFSAELNTNGVGPTLSVLESDDTTASNFGTITADRSAENLTAAKLVEYHVDLRGKKRYLRLSVTTATATNDNVTVGAVARLTRNEKDPTSTSDMADVVVLV